MSYTITSFRAISALRQTVEQSNRKRDKKAFMIACKAQLSILKNVKRLFRLKARFLSAIQDEVDQVLQGDKN